jgi:capsular exopolysaccharide synthesis family protein
MKKHINTDEINLEKLYRTIINYKWLILSIILVVFSFTFLSLYFKPSIYSSSAILEIKSKTKTSSANNDLIFNAFAKSGGGGIEKEIEILKTFPINKEALEKVNFKIRFYKNKNYKDVEIYENIPIEISDVRIFNNDIIGHKITLYPENNNFRIEVKKSLLSKIFSTSSIILNKDRLYAYDKNITNEYFECSIKRIDESKKPISFVIYGDDREIYDTLIRDNLDVKQINPNAPLIEISYEDSIPKRANDYVNAVANSFIRKSIMRKNEQNSKVINFIDKQLLTIKETLKISENKLAKYKVLNKIAEPSIEASTYIKKLSDIEIELSESSLKEKLVSNLINFTQHNQKLDSIAPALMELHDQPTLQLITSLQSLQLKRESLETEFTNQHPKMLSLLKQIENIRKKIILNIRNLKENIIQRTAIFKKEKKSYEKKIKMLPTKEKKLVNINRDYQVSSSMYNYLLKKRTENEILMVSILSDYKIIDSAHTTGIPIKPKRLLMLVASLFVGLLIGIVLAVMLQGMNNRINSKEDLESLTNLPLYGIIPALENRDIQIEVFLNPNSHFTESFRSLRSHIQVKKKLVGGNIILITSTVEGEGKSTLTANLGAVFQMVGYKTLVINLDLRKPTLHSYFNLQNSKGISGFLNNKETIHEIVFSTEYENLHFIPSGTIPSNPSELILSNKLSILLEFLKTKYDYIFIDSAPIGLVSDTIHIMKYTDINLVVFREGYSDKLAIESLENTIEKHTLDNVGVVFNYSHSKDRKKSYGYGYGYG